MMSSKNDAVPPVNATRCRQNAKMAFPEQNPH